MQLNIAKTFEVSNDIGLAVPGSCKSSVIISEIGHNRAATLYYNGLSVTYRSLGSSVSSLIYITYYGYDEISVKHDVE